MERKRIIIETKETPDGETTTFKKEGYNDFETVGILAYYKDCHQVLMMKDNRPSPNQQLTK